MCASGCGGGCARARRRQTQRQPDVAVVAHGGSSEARPLYRRQAGSGGGALGAQRASVDVEEGGTEEEETDGCKDD